ncbi:hypothetical protein QU593_09995 [Rossellomorea marisflavi]|uniref:hypothetical protein n=1 Tax=Rossellomorea marisflavi TaxID=189381 RepID=UPI0025AEF34B|nr:hypothetical protein [Rossellomorea marisflavi]WJV20735.1 hypothetical protein QU593_09995 [Rossellomorea marisflavi]
MIKKYTANDIALMHVGDELDRIVHELNDRGEKHHWLHVPEYSTDLTELIMLMSELKDYGEYITFTTTPGGFRTEFKGTVTESYNVSESVCKAYVIGSIQYNK